jgi:uncharacterized protein (TIGR03083 family)
VTSPARSVTVLPKDDVVSALFASWDDIDDLMTPLPEEQWRAPSHLQGWTVHCLVAHIIGTELMLLGEPTPDVDVSASEHVRNEIGALNEAWVRHLSGQSGAQLLQTFRTITDRRRAALAALTDEQWNAVGVTPAGADSYGRFMRIRVFDCWMHEQDIRDALALPATAEELAGPAARIALDEIVASMGFVVGKRGRAPEGSRVEIELTGLLPRTIRVAVDGRAAVVDDFGGATPTTTIRMDGVQFTRRCGGRTVGQDDVDYGGDQEVGRRIVENLAYVI